MRRVKQLSILALLCSLLIALIGVASAQDLSGTITIYPQNYYSPDDRPEAAAAVEAVIQEYMDMHPGVTVELVPSVPTGTDYLAWLTTRLAAGNAPNIAWQQFYDRNRQGSETWVPLNDFFEMPNPYIPEGTPGHDRWADSFPEFVLAQTRAGDGNWYQVSLDWVETGLYINTGVMEANGLDAQWDGWNDFLGDCDKLKAAGVQPVGVFMTPEWSTYQWLDDIFTSIAFGHLAPDWYLPQYSSEFLPWRQLVTEEMAKAVHDGEFNVNMPEFDFYLQITKDFADRCLIEGFAGIANYDEMQRLFIEGQVGMAWLGSWSSVFLSENIEFPFSVTYLPAFTADENPFATEVTSYRVGGPSSAGQYGIPQATVDAGLIEEAIDLLMYWSAPAQFQRVYDATPDLIPMVAGMTANEAALGFQFVAGMPERAFTDPIGRLTPEYGTEHNRLFQQFMLGEITADQLKTEYQPILEKAAADLCAEQNYDWCAS
jgi:multiple sugar transport system substrate-binding protein